MSNEAGADWQCAYDKCRKVLRGTPAQSPLPNCPYCRRTQPGFHVDPGPGLPPASASAWPSQPPGSQASDQSASGTGSVGGGVFTQPSGGQGPGQYVVITQQQMQEMQRMEARGLPLPPPPQHQQISLEQQQLYYQQQLDEKQRKHQQLKQQHSEQLQMLKTMEWNNGQQLGADQQQQIERQRMWCQKLWIDQETVLKEYQELWHQLIMLGGISEQQELFKYEQQLVGIEGQLRQKYEQEYQQLNSMELNIHEHQLSYDQQQHLLGQRALCQQLEGDLRIAMNRRQEFQHKFMKGRGFQSGLQTSYGHQQNKVLQPDGTWGVPEAPEQQQQYQQVPPPPPPPPQRVLWGAENNTQWSGGGQQQEDEQRRLQLEQQRQYGENEQWRLAEQQRQRREDEQRQLQLEQQREEERRRLQLEQQREEERRRMQLEQQREEERRRLQLEQQREEEQRRMQLEQQREEERRLLAEQQQKEHELALIDSQQEQLLAERQKKIEEEQIQFEQQKRLQQQQQRVNIMETGGAGQPSHDQRKQDEQQHTQSEQRREVKQQQQPSHDQQQLTGDEYKRSVQKQMQAWKSQMGDTLSQQKEGKKEQRRLREEQVSVQIGDAQLGNQQQHDQSKVAGQQQERGEGSDPNHDQQQQPNQEQLAEIHKVFRALKQQYDQEFNKLKSMELESSEKQLSHDQQQQLERQNSVCQQLWNNLQELQKQEKELHGQQLKSMLKLGNRHENQETAGQQLRSEQQGEGIQPSHGQQEQDKEQHVQPEKHGGVNQQQGAEQQEPQEPSRDQNQQTVDEYGQSVQQLIDAWQKKSQTGDTQQPSKHPNRQESKQRQKMEQQQEQNKQSTQNLQEKHSDHRSQGGDVVYCECGTPFYPNAIACAKPNCGKPRPRNLPQGPPCVHCGKRLIKEGAIRCESCNKKQPEVTTKPAKGPIPLPPPPGLAQGYGYSNPPQQQHGAGVQPPSSTEMVASRYSVPHTSHSTMVFGDSAYITSGSSYRPITSQFYSGGNKNIQAAKGVAGALPSNQGNDGGENLGPPVGVPGSARSTKADGKDSTLAPCTTHPLNAGNLATQSQANGSTKLNQPTPQDNNNNGKTTGGTNGEPVNRTAGAGGTSEPQSAGGGVAPDPPITTDDSATGKNNTGSQGGGAVSSTNSNQKSYASVTRQKENGQWHMKSKEPQHLLPPSKKSAKESKPPVKKIYDISGLECSDPKSSMKLVFHAIVPLPYWEWDDKKTCMHIRFGHSKLGSWAENCGKFQVTRKIDDIHCEMTCSFDTFNVELLNSSALIPYKYVVINSPKVVDKDDCFEFLHAHSNHGDVNRCLQLSSENFLHIHQMSPGEKIYHKYDMIVYPKKTQISKSILETISEYASRFKGWFTRKKKTTSSEEEEFVPMKFYEMGVFCLQSYLEEYKAIMCEGRFQQGTNIMEIVDSVTYVLNSLIPFIIMRRQGNSALKVDLDASDKKKYKGEIKEWTMSLLKELEERPLQEPGKQLTVAFFILACLGKTYQVYQSPQSMANSLIRIFVLNPDLENRSCPDYEFLRGCLGESTQDELSIYLRYLCKKVAGKDGGSPIEWMLALPLYHFLKGLTEPFGEPELTIKWEGEQDLGLKSVQQKSNSLDDFVISHYKKVEPYFAFDPLLPAAFVALTPEAEFPLLCERMPPFLTASRFTHILKTETADNSFKVVHIKKWISQIQCVKNSMARQNDSDVKELLLVVKSSYQVLDIARKKKFSEHILSLICESASYVLHAIAQVDKAASKDDDKVPQWNSRSETFQKMRTVFHEWIAREDVIGGSLFGGTIPYYSSRRKYRGKEELQYWNALLSVDAATPEGTQDWHNTIKPLIDKRIRDVEKPTSSIDLVFTMEEIGDVNPVLADLIMEAGYRAIDKLYSQPQHSGRNQLERLATHESERVGKLLGRILEKQYPNARDIEGVSFDDLLDWHMWPIFITIFVSKPALQRGIPQEYDMAGMCARSRLEGTCDQLQSGEVNIADLQKVNKNREQMQRLCLAISSSEDGRYLYESVETAVYKRLEEYEAVKRRKEILSHLSRHIYFEEVQGLTELQAELGKDIDKELISTMCVRNENDNIVLNCFLSAASLLKFANQFQLIGGEVHCSEIFLGFWRKTLNEAITDNPQLSLSDIYASVWQPSIGLCRKLLESLEDQSIKLSDVDTDLQPYYDRLEAHLELLHKCMTDITRKSGNLYQIKKAAQRVREYWNLCHYQRSANTFLELKKTLGLTTGDFKLVEKLSQQLSTSMKDQTLKDVDDTLIEAGKFMEDVARVPSKVHCLERFAKCKEIVEWLKGVTKDVHEIQSFVNVALATAAGGEGDLSHDRLSHLRTVGSGFASLIYNFPEDADFFKLKEACKSVWDALDKNENLPKLIEDCNKDVSWYQSVKETQGSVEVTSYGQMRNILRYGIYQVGVASQSKLPQDIHDVIFVKLNLPKDVKVLKTFYNLDELRDLESKLVLITGSKGEYRTEVDHYLNILQHVTRIAEVLLNLQKAGNVTYSGWKVSFDCATYTVTGSGKDEQVQLQEESADQRVKELQAYAKTMEDDLTSWEKKVKESRSRHYELNYYTTLQLLRLRKELGLVHQSPTKMVDPQILALLESISPAVTSSNVQSIIGSLQRQLMDLQLQTEDSEENTQIEPADIATTEDLSGSMELHAASRASMEMQPTSRLSSVKPPSDRPQLTEKDLNDDQKKIFTDLVEYKEYDKLLVLKAFEQLPAKSNLYDIQDWCDEKEGEYDFEEEEEEEETATSSDEYYSTDSGSDDEERVTQTVFNRKSFSAATPGSEKHRAFSSGDVVPKVKVIHRQIINESHPVVQQLVEEYEYDLDASIEAVQLFGSKQGAMDYLAGKEGDSGDEEMIAPNAALLEPALEESGTIVVFDDPEAEKKYLTLDQLGFVLKHLSEQLPASVIAQRTFDDEELKPGTPNLIIIPASDILRTVLALYMDDEDLPLPTLEEVLICNSTTTAEEVNLLWQRAIGDPGKKRIFCLVHAEKLSYQVCDEVVGTLKELSQGKLDYRLVILCSKEGEDKSHIVSKLLLHKKSIVLKHSQETYQSYLKNHFVCGDGDSLSLATPDAASVVDCDNSSVRVVSSERSGMGKSLYIRRMAEQLETVTEAKLKDCQVVIPIHGPVVTPDVVLKFLKEHYRKNKCVMYHFDIAPSILSEVDTILFSLLILHGLTDSQGCVWRRHLSQLYTIEVTLLKKSAPEMDPAARTVDLLSLLPTVNCISPKMAKEASTLDPSQIGMDREEFGYSTFQRVYQYLRRHETNSKLLNRFKYEGRVEGDTADCLKYLLNNCGVYNPSWSEIHHFAKFLDVQLESSEKSVFCDEQFIGDVVSAFKAFVVKLMIRMSRDFATPSLEGEVARGSVEDQPVGDTNNLQQYKIERRRKWEESSHPYIFFNKDGFSITFVGFIINPNGDLVDLKKTVLEPRIMMPQQYTGLKSNGVNFDDDYHQWQKDTMIEKITTVMGIDSLANPDETYVLTVDNLIKILAIQMRFRCGIPVVIMGETGCGKTRLIRYMCDLAREGREARNMLILKVHGGTKEEDIIRFIAEAEEEAEKNRALNMDTVVFFDEANTTDAIGLIKEILCDRRLHGRPFSDDLKFIAACNPYRRHSDEMIKRLEKAGLGFYVRASETQQRLGRIPLRELVYRVLDLPPSMRPLVYDFGQLKKGTEDEYIEHIVGDHMQKHPTLSTEDPGIVSAIASVLAASQAYMRKREDECSFVSLRDVERAMIVFKYFYEKMPDFQKEAKEKPLVQATQGDPALRTITSALILAVSVCYHSRLQDRKEYEKHISEHFVSPLVLPGKEAQFVQEICWYQNVLLDNMVLGPNIAKNAALRENVFMMAICIELRIPLFLVGKPGSSKSLAKSIIQDSMHGKNSRNELLKKFKQVQMFSYQCSQLATSESVIEVFNSAKKFQDRSDTTQLVSVVVLDEVGLAEDSPNLPLKALHPLLEDGTEGAGAKGKDEIIEREKRVAFIGISNWALDPAKMNRGVMVTRGTPDIKELEFSAGGICGKEDNDQIKNQLKPYFKSLAQAYEVICKKQKREFFGLRDFYSLIKMLYWICKKSRSRPLTWPQMKHAIMRNFGGLKSDEVDPFQEFCKRLNMAEEEPDPDKYVDDQEIWPIVNPDCSRLGLIKTSLDTRETSFHGENRYLLFLTENYAALDILKHYIRGKDHDPSTTGDTEGSTASQKPFTLFGSSFPKDREYTQVCRNINQIKICMETGRTVILLNLENLYESLYDVLNQYYMHYGDSRYVDLGLQTHRVKCRVHNDFKLILIAERETVYEKFPTPLINRLEKHFVLTSSILKDWQLEVLTDFKDWISGFSSIRDDSGKGNFEEGHAFIGYQKDTPAAVVFQASKQLKKYRKGLSMSRLSESGILGDIPTEELVKEAKDSDMWKDAVLRLSQFLLLQTASDDSLVRLAMTDLAHQQKELMRLYFNEQHHKSVADFISYHIQNSDETKEGLLLQVTTHGHILLREEVIELVNVGALIDMKVESFLLQEFDTELDFSNKVGPMFQRDEEDKQNRLLVIQCDSGHLNGDLIACARYRVYDERVNALNKNKIQNRDGVTHVLFIINLPHQVSSSTFVGFQGNPWISSHIDDLRPTSSDTIEPLHAIATNISELFIGEYIHDIAPLLEGTLEQFSPRQPDKEENLPDEEEVTQQMPVHDAGADADVENEEDDDIDAHQIQPELQAVGGEPGTDDAYQMQPELVVHDAIGEPDTEAYQMQPELLATNSSPEHSPTEQLPEIPEQRSVPFEPTVLVDPHQQQQFQEKEDEESSTNLATAETNEITEPDVTTYQEDPAHLESMGSDEHQAGVPHESVALPTVDESVTPSQAAFSTEPEVLTMADVNPEGASELEIHPIAQKLGMRQTPSGQCRRLYGCIQAAASRLEDSTKDRSTQRVTRLTKLIQRSPKHLDPQSFHGILVMHIYRLLQERESDKPDLANWVLDEALNSSSLEVGGTFRNVLARKIDEVVIPIFAKIIASIDRNYNLDHINPKAGDTPLVQFWLAMFKDPQVQQLQYSEMAQGGKVIGLGGRMLDRDFKCELPFFWLIKDAMDSQWDSAKTKAGPGASWQVHHEHLCECVCDTPVGVVLGAVDSDNCEIFYSLYLHDFVMGMHRCKHKSSDLKAMEVKLVSDALDHIVHCSVFQHKSSLTSMIAALHLAYGMNKSQLLWFNQLVSHSPSIMLSLEGVPPSEDAQEMELHLYAAEKVIEKLEPPLQKDNPNANLAQWLNHVRLSQNTIDLVLSLRSQNKRVIKARQNWNRLRAIQLFVERVMLKHPEIASLKLMARRLCGRWEESCDFLKLSTVNGVQLQLNSMEKVLKKEKVYDEKKRREVKRSCRGFFMEIISNLCFKGQAAPEPDLVKMLLDIVFMEKGKLHTQELTPYKDDKSVGDKIPTVRSFLLQLLLEHSVHQVEAHLRDYLDRSYRLLVENEAEVADQNLYLLIIQCFEDALYKTTSTQDLASIVQEVTEILNEGYGGLQEHRHGTPTLEYLEGVAKVRYSLSVVAEVLKEGHKEHYFVELLKAAAKMCSDREVNCIDPAERQNTMGPLIYLLKLIVRQYGMPCLRVAAQVHDWLIPTQLKTKHEKSMDPFAIYDDHYKNLREAMSDAVCGDQIDALTEATETLKSSEVPYIILALYEKATLSRTTDSKISDDALERLNEFIKNCQSFSDEVRLTARALLANQQGGRVLEQMVVSPRQPLRYRTILGVVVHAVAVFFGRQDVDILLPFVNILNNPAILKQCFLPTMQEDPLTGSQSAMMAGGKIGQFYECPNGHKTFIGNHGRTPHTGMCFVCKTPIVSTTDDDSGTGGKLSNTQDTTRKGYDLGAPANRTHTAPERHLSARAVCILRALMHSAFLWASCNNPSSLGEIASLITPQVLPKDLPEFFWAHLDKDLELLGRDTGKGLDEVVMIVHLVLREILTTAPPSGGKVRTISSLQAKKDRKEWEKLFNEHYIQPVLSTLDENLAEAMDRVADDEKQDHGQLFHLVYEKVKYSEESLEPHLWTYRSRITLEHLRQTLQEEKMRQEYPILSEFLQAETELRATQYLPDIARLQQCLYDKFNQQIDRKDIKKLTIQMFIKELPNETAKNEYREMISSVKAAWALVGHKLKNHGRLPVEDRFYTTVIDDDTKMEYLVPTTSEAGVCTTALVDFLTLTHNNFITTCRAHVGENDQSTLKFWSEHKVPITHLHRCHLLDYEHQLPSIILSHCHYSLKVGKGQIVKYDHQALEKHILNLFIHGKPLILPDIPQVVYKKDIYSIATFADVRKKVEPQVKLEQTVRQAIIAELKTPHLLRESLDVMEIILGFLSSGGGRADKPLGDYINKTLKMKNRLFSKEAKNSCQLKHALALWEAIAVRLAIKLCISGQEPFNFIHKEFLCELSKVGENQCEALDRCLGQFEPDLLLGTLYEFIETYIKHCPLKERDQPLKVTLVKQYGTELPQLDKFPASIKLDQAVAAWKHIVHHYYDKKQ